MVNYTSKEEKESNRLKAYNESAKLDANTEYKLNEVVITSRSSFTPERDGRVSVDFFVAVPEKLISDNWSITLTPELLHNDSVVPLKDIVINGEEFYNKQQVGYEKYDEYLGTIIEKKDYDSAYLDVKGIRTEFAPETKPLSESVQRRLERDEGL